MWVDNISPFFLQVEKLKTEASIVEQIEALGLESWPLAWAEPRPNSVWTNESQFFVVLWMPFFAADHREMVTWYS